MKQGDKQLLLQDLCARLPYGVIVDYKENEFETPHWKITTIYPNTFNGWIGYDKRVGAGSESGSRPFNIGEVKPYLRPLSTMTEEERKSLPFPWVNNFGVISSYNECEGFIEITHDDFSRIIDWLNAHHFDYRGLISKDLAIEVTEENNPYKD